MAVAAHPTEVRSELKPGRSRPGHALTVHSREDRVDRRTIWSTAKLQDAYGGDLHQAANAPGAERFRSLQGSQVGSAHAQATGEASIVSR